MSSRLVQRRTPQERKDRIAVESMLAVSGNKTVSLPSSNLSLNSYAVSFFIVPTGSNWSISKGSFSISQSDVTLEQNRLYHVVYQSGEYYINGVKAGTHSKVWDTVSDVIVSGDCLINHLTFFNRTLTQDEIKYIRRWSGIIPESTHAPCVAHYVTDRQGRTMWDCVEQYNYAKAELDRLTAQHGTLINYTDAEVGLPNLSLQTAYKDFYTKYNLLASCLKIQIGNTGIYQSALPVEVFTNNDFSFFYEGGVSDIVAQPGLFSVKQKASPYTSHLYLYFIDNTLHIKIGDQSISVPSINLNNPYSLFFKLYLERVGSQEPHIYRIYINNIPAAYNIMGSQEIKQMELYYIRMNESGNNSSKYHARLHIFNRLLTEQERNLLFNSDKEKVGGDNVIEEVVFSGASTEIGSSGTSYNFTSGNLSIAEKKSLLPPLQNALQFNGTSQYAAVNNFSPSNENGYTFFAAFVLDSDRDFKPSPYPDNIFAMRAEDNTSAYLLMTGWDTDRIKFWYKNTGVSAVGNFLPTTQGNNLRPKSQVNMVHYIVENNKGHIYCNGRLVTTVNLAYMPDLSQYGGTLKMAMDDYVDSNRALHGGFLQAGIAKGVMTAKQVKEHCNNILLSQPAKRWTNLDWQLIPNFNHIIDNTAVVAGQYLVEDLSGKGHTIEAIGYTAANLDPNDPAYSLTKINDLR